MSTMADELCGWCGEARWTFSCAMCDPRRLKKMCGGCMGRWHSRGFSQEHTLTNRFGQALSYRAWASMQKLPALEKNGATGRASGDENAVANGTVATEKTQTEVEKDSGDALEEKQDAVDAAIEFGGGDVEDEAKEGVEQSGGKQASTTLELEKNDSMGNREEKDTPAAAAAAEAANAHAANGFSGTNKLPAEGQASEHQKAATVEQQEVKAAVPEVKASGATVSAVPASSQGSQGVQATTTTATTVATTTTTNDAPVAPSGATVGKSSQQDMVELEKLLRWFPTEDRSLLEKLALRIEAALVIEDELMCARIGKCRDASCRSTLKHYEHCKTDEICNDPKCYEIAVVYRHRRACQKKENEAPDGKKPVCPFCIRIRQRRSLGAIAALDHVISEQRRMLRDPNGAQSEASRNFCLQSIGTCTDRKQLHRAEVEKLNALARQSSVPVFNFPRYSWHLGGAVAIKREPVQVSSSSSAPPKPLDSDSTVPAKSTSTTNASPMAESDPNDFVAATPQTPEEIDGNQSPDDNVPDQQVTSNGSAPEGSTTPGDFIGHLLKAKHANGPEGQTAQQNFDKAVELGYAIVDSSFCAPAKAQRCLLNCQSILQHLQHHLDMNVCSHHMCTSVEHHFGHLSKCKASGESSSCEYCLRIEERKFARQIDIMEADQPESEARVQSIINAITASFTNDPPDEREQTLVQLEDELDQAEDDKRELLERLNTSRDKLRKVRRRMELHGMETSASRRLPLHFVKIARGEPGSAAKKQRID